MSLLMGIKVILTISVLILFIWTFKTSNNVDDETFKYGRYIIYLLLLEVVLLLVFSSK